MAAAQDILGEQDTIFRIPWWRVLKDGRPSRHMPGGVAGQLALLQTEGVRL
jgi:alkylated DNA nucleotide flippase Atl1